MRQILAVQPHRPLKIGIGIGIVMATLADCFDTDTDTDFDQHESSCGDAAPPLASFTDLPG